VVTETQAPDRNMHDAAHGLRTRMEASRLLHEMPKPTIAAIAGAAAGAGLALALAADIRIASDAARFTVAFLKVGFVPDAGAVWLLIGRPLLARLAGGTVESAGFDAALSRKVTSRLGFAEVVPVRRDHDGVTPLASDYLPLAALTAADGWVLVGADSEGHPAGARVRVRPLP